MSFEQLPNEILYIIRSYLNDNKTIINFISTCKYLKKLFYKYGYLNYLSLNTFGDPYKFAIMTCKHENTLKQIAIYNVFNPQVYIFYWPKIVFINNCFINGKIDPSHEVITEKLTIINNRSCLKTDINSKKFPKLKELILN